LVYEDSLFAEVYEDMTSVSKTSSTLLDLSFVFITRRPHQQLNLAPRDLLTRWCQN